jgi:hypothetical protein
MILQTKILTFQLRVSETKLTKSVLLNQSCYLNVTVFAVIFDGHTFSPFLRSLIHSSGLCLLRKLLDAALNSVSHTAVFKHCQCFTSSRLSHLAAESLYVRLKACVLF